jgi:hypothetical protein
MAGTAISATVGGFASVAGGGKFANGAVAGAFGYLFNDFSHLWYGTDAHYSIEISRVNSKLDACALIWCIFDAGAEEIDVYEIKAERSLADGWLRRKHSTMSTL